MSEVAYFDELDTFYLANTLTLSQLRKEITHAERILSLLKLHEQFEGTEYEYTAEFEHFKPGLIWLGTWLIDDAILAEIKAFPYTDYIQCCREAIKCQQASKPKPTPARGKVDIEAIKAQNDIVAVIEGYTKLRKSGKNFTGRCPIHQDKNPSLAVYPDKQTWHCFGACNRGGDVIAFIQAVEHTDFKGAAAILGST